MTFSIFREKRSFQCVFEILLGVFPHEKRIVQKQLWQSQQILLILDKLTLTQLSKVLQGSSSPANKKLGTTCKIVDSTLKKYENKVEVDDDSFLIKRSFQWKLQSFYSLRRKGLELKDSTRKFLFVQIQKQDFYTDKSSSYRAKLIPCYKNEGSHHFFMYFISKITYSIVNQLRLQYLMMKEGEKKGCDMPHGIKMENIESNQVQQRENLAQIYECSCGKQYKSFPAIYLHFRTKHEIKLSTKDTQIRKKTIEGQKSKKYVYCVETTSQENENGSHNREHMQTKNHISSDLYRGNVNTEIQICVRSFLFQNKEEDPEIYHCLQKYFTDSAQHSQVYETEGLSLQTLPYYFNQFMLDFLPEQMPRVKIGSLKWKSACKSLQMFAEYLHKEEKTPLILTYDL